MPPATACLRQSLRTGLGKAQGKNGLGQTPLLLPFGLSLSKPPFFGNNACKYLPLNTAALSPS